MYRKGSGTLNENKLLLTLTACSFALLLSTINLNSQRNEIRVLESRIEQATNTISTLEGEKALLRIENRELRQKLKEVRYLNGKNAEEISKLKKLAESTTFVTQNELHILRRIATAEATSGTIEQKMNVTDCVLNRVESRHFPNDVRGVVFQRRQFSPISDGRYYEVEITEDSIEAVDRVLKGERNQEKPLFFMCEAMADPNNAYWFKNNLRLVKNDKLHTYYCYRKGE